MTPQLNRDGEVVIEARGIVKSFGGAVAVDNVSILCEREKSTQLSGRTVPANQP